MCGLFAVITNYVNKEELENFRTLGAISFPRGDDSTGLAYCRRKTYTGTDVGYGFDKAVGDPWGYLYSTTLDKYLSDRGNFRALVGHCRSATIGKITRENAHPYKFGNIIGVHNGTIHSLEKQNQEGTDSEELYKRIARDGAHKTLTDVRDGAYALMWFDMLDDTLNIIRNDQRPLWIMRTSVGNTWYVASERIFLQYIDARSNTVFNDPELLSTNTLYQFDMKNIGVPKVTKDFISDAPSVQFLRHYPGAVESPWDSEDEQKVEKKEQEKKPATVVPMLPSPPKEKDEGEIPFLDSTAWSTNDPSLVGKFKNQSIVKAFDILPSSLVKLPTRVLIDRAFKILRYRGYNGKLIKPIDFYQYITEGSAWSRSIPRHQDPIYWIGSKEYVLEDEAFDKEFREFLMSENNPPQLGEWVFCSPNEIQKENKKHVH